MNLTIEITPKKQIQPTRALFWTVRGDEELLFEPYWGVSRTLSIFHGSFVQLPSVFRFDRFAQPNKNDWRVDETELRADYIRINDYDGDGMRRCENYLWKDGIALYNNKGFPLRQYLTMSRNVLKEIAIEEDDQRRKYLKFETIRPGYMDTSAMTYESHPWLVHRFDLVGHNKLGETYHTYNTPRGNVYFFLTSREGYGYIPMEFVAPPGGAG